MATEYGQVGLDTYFKWVIFVWFWSGIIKVLITEILENVESHKEEFIEYQ